MTTLRFRRRPRARSGFTVVEVILAIIVLGIGVLGLAGTAGVVTNQMGGGGTRTVAAGVAQSVFDSLNARPCTSITSGSAVMNRVNVAWTVADSGETRWIRQTLTFRTRRGMKTYSYSSMIWCRD